mmetsp:Transcript_40790/g.115694  ORF Transcript_40790/g.115694 Transcript_40790/m.115694 type:complete len:372 (-) Transcript_40790:223-1338(-)
MPWRGSLSSSASAMAAGFAASTLGFASLRPLGMNFSKACIFFSSSACFAAAIAALKPSARFARAAAAAAELVALAAAASTSKRRAASPSSSSSFSASGSGEKGVGGGSGVAMNIASTPPIPRSSSSSDASGDEACASMILQSPDGSKEISFTVSSATEEIAFVMYESTKTSARGSKGKSHTGQVLPLLIRNASRSKHCKCWHLVPREAVFILSMETGQSKQRRLRSESASPFEADRNSTIPFLHSSFSFTTTFLMMRFAANLSLMTSWRFALSSAPVSTAWRRAKSFSRMASRRCSGSVGALRFLPPPPPSTPAPALSPPAPSPAASGGGASTLGKSSGFLFSGSSRPESFLTLSNAHFTRLESSLLLFCQ